MATLTAQGLGSGLDISGLVTKLVAAEGDTKKAQLTNQETKLTAEFSAIGTLKSALASVQSSLAKIDQASDFAGVKATAADPELFSATADTDAATGQYQIESLRLAQAHKLASATFASDQKLGGTQDDSLTLTVNGGSLKLDLSGGKTLAEIRDAINAATDNPGVQATLVNAGDGQQALVLTSKQTGYDNRIEVAESLAGGESLSLATVNRDADGNTLAERADRRHRRRHHNPHEGSARYPVEPQRGTGYRHDQLERLRLRPELQRAGQDPGLALRLSGGGGNPAGALRGLHDPQRR
jgi:flagellar hook-associated protein 2